MRAVAAVGLVGGLALACVCACEEACEEDVRAQVLARRAEITVGGESVDAEVAVSQVERERGWMHRRCGMEALALVPEAPAEVPVWTCAMTSALDLFFVEGGSVVAVVRGAEPCAEPCGAGCPRFGEGVVVDAVIEAPAGALRAEVGDPVTGIDGLAGG